MVSGPLFAAWLELAIAARTDSELRPRVAALDARFMETVRRTFRDLFPAPPEVDPFHEAAPTFVFALMEGLALQETVSGDVETPRRVLDALKTLAWLVLPRAAS
jgi:hypothetical protein